MAGSSTTKKHFMQVELLTVPEVAKWAKVSTKTVYRWITEGKLEAIRFGSRTYRIPTPSVENLLRSQGYTYLVDGE